MDNALKQRHLEKFFTIIKSKLTGDFLFKNLAAIVAASAIVILVITGYVLTTGSVPVVQKFGQTFSSVTLGTLLKAEKSTVHFHTWWAPLSLLALPS